MTFGRFPELANVSSEAWALEGKKDPMVRMARVRIGSRDRFSIRGTSSRGLDWGGQGGLGMRISIESLYQYIIYIK
jgi:hypothetical protein